jgi:hypothetical protein
MRAARRIRCRLASASDRIGVAPLAPVDPPSGALALSTIF